MVVEKIPGAEEVSAYSGDIKKGKKEVKEAVERIKEKTHSWKNTQK